MSITWTITKNSATNKVTFEADVAALIDLNQVVIGDYANIYGNGFNPSNQGSFEITNVEVYYTGGGTVLHQIFEIYNPSGISESAVQTANDDLTFFRPTKNTTQAGSRTVVVSSTVDGQLEVAIPATTQAVARQVGTGAYVHSNSTVEVTKIDRNASGLVTVQYSGSPSPALSTGDYFYLDNVGPTPFASFRSTGDAGVYPAVAESDASNQDIVDLLQENTSDTGRRNFVTVLASNGDGLSIGGSTLLANVATANGNVCRYRDSSSAIVADDTLADGATRYSYQWEASGVDTLNTEHLRVSNILGGPAVGQVMISGGLNIALANWSARQINLLPSTYKYDPTTNLTTVSGTMTTPWVSHTQTSLDDGRILVYGGGTLGTSAYLGGLNSKEGYIWDPGTESWSGSVSVTGTYTRAHHTATQLDDGYVLFTGGLAGATGHLVDSYTLAKWNMDELAGVTITDTSGNGYNLTESGTVAHVNGSKITNGREFTQAAAHATGAGDAGAVTALLGDWTVEWWSCGATGTYPGSMVLSGLGSGTIVAYGGVGSELEADNTIMHVGITGGNLFWRWEHGAGVDETGSFAISGTITDTYNHFAVRKKYNGATYDVTLYVNGTLIGTSSGVTNASGGSTSQWYVARDPDGTTGFSGVIEDLRVSSVARTSQEILLDYWTGSSSIPGSVGSQRIGPLVHQCEIWDSTGSPTTDLVGSMGLARAYHTATLMPNGNVIVIGGLAHNPTSFAQSLVDAGPSDLYGCSASTNTCEIYDIGTQSWYKGPTLGIRRHNHTAIYVSSRNAIFVIGGQSTQGDDCKNIEIINLNDMSVGTYSEKLTYDVGGALLMDTGNILCFTSEPDGIGGLVNVHQQLILSGSAVTSPKGLNGSHKITADGAGYLQFQSEVESYFTNFGKPSQSDSITVSAGTRVTNVTQLDFVAAGHPFQVGDVVYVNLNYNVAGFSSGLKTITAIAAGSIYYSETGNVVLTSLTGEVYKNYSPEAVVTSSDAVADSIGPYIFDPVDGVAVTSTESAVGGSLYAGLYKGQKYTVLPVVDATVFPDEAGYVVLGFGTDYQTSPIRYYGRYNEYGLLIDYSYTFLNDIAETTTVTLLSQREPFEPTTLVGSAYVTASSAGRVAAENTVKDIAAAGINLNIDIIYPGDRGLGGEGLPASGATKLSDKTAVWAGDDIDSEIQDLKS